uniref:BZIP domain-containing protein n=1 Tax=Denticeps clupeoides TaxID=299321 RepID=A0AAY4AXE5_9TELE
MPQPSISGMDPPFGDAFQNYTFADQALTSTDLLANSSDPDFMYELDREMTCRQSPKGDVFGVGECRELEGLDQLSDLGESSEPTSNFEQWDSYWEDLTKYTRLTSCDIWGTKEVDFLGLDDFSSPYQDEEVIGRTPTLAQLNSEDSQPVCDTLYHPDLLMCPKQQVLLPPPAASQGKKANHLTTSSFITSFTSSSSQNTLPDFPEGSQKATWPVASSTETMAKAQRHGPPPADGSSSDFVCKAKVRISGPHRPPGKNSDTQVTVTPSAGPVAERPRGSETLLPIGAMGAATDGATTAAAAAEKKKEEEHNYSLFLTREEEEGEEEEEYDGGLELDDEDHDEGFGSEHELSENDDEEEEEDEDYEGDKDDDISDAFSEPGCDADMAEDMKGLTAGLSRQRGKRRYFWEYSEQLAPSKQERMLKPSEWDRDTLPSNMYQKNGLHHGKYTLKKSRRTDVEDLTPNPRKLLQIGNELRKLNKVISDLTPVSELPLTARPRSRKEKNKLASRACRLKKKAQYEANKVKLWGLGTEYDRLLFVINAIKEEIVNRVQDLSEDKCTSMAEKLDKLIEDTLVKSPVAGQTSDFVNQILENTGKGDPTGGLVGLRVPTSKV